MRKNLVRERTIKLQYSGRQEKASVFTFKFLKIAGKQDRRMDFYRGESKLSEYKLH